MSSMSLSSPCMSDRTLLLSVEDLINIAMGPHEGNTVDFKMVQTILHILARQMRLLEQKVVLVAGDLPVLKQSGKDDRRHSSSVSEESRSRDSIPEDEKDGARSQQTSLEFRMERKKGYRDRRGTKSGSTVWQGRDGRKRGRDSDGRDRSRGGRARDDDGEEREGRHRRRGSREGDGEAGRGGSRERRKSGSRGRDGDDREKSRGRRGSMDDYDDERGGRGRSRGRHADGYDDEKEGRGRSGGRHADDHDDERGGRSRGRRYDDEDGKEGRGRSGGRGADDYDDEKGGRGGSRGRHADGYDDEKGGRGRSSGRHADDDELGRGGRGRSHRGRDDEDDEDERSVRGRSRGRGGDNEDYEGGHARSRGGRRDDEDGSEGRGRSGGRRDRDDEEASSGKGRGGRGRDDEDEKLDRGRHERRGEHGSPGGRREESDGGRDRDGRYGRDGDESETRGRGGRGKEGIGIREVDGPGKDKLLVVVKSSTAGSDRERRDSIAVVTQSQFRFLVDAVEELREMAGPLPALTMPDNKQLRKDLAAGASLTDTMQAMQVEARVKAAEEAIGHLGGLLTQLAASGALPSDALAGALGTGAQGNVGESAGALGSVKGKGTRHVTEPELGKALDDLKKELTKELQNPINKAATAAEAAETTAKFVGAKVEELLKMVSRVSEMHTMVEEYAQQLDGFDAGLTTQMATFKEQMSTMRTDLQTGMAQLEAANNNPETAAVMELNERYEELVRGLEDTLLQHNSLTTTQHQLTLELKSLVESVEMLREQKADRDELMDGLRDKADMMRLEGLVRQEEFEKAREDLDQQISVCHEKFLKQDEIWREVLKDLEEQVNTKALVVDLMKVRDEATAQLRDVSDTIKKLELMLGEPEAAMLMRALSRGAVCGACLAPALMAPGDVIAPPRLPGARPAPPEQPCVPEQQAPKQPDLRTHKCHRWVGGSHTLLPRGPGPTAPAPALPDVTRKYVGYGDDGRLYRMETATAPCVECNPEPPPVTARSDAGAGDADAGIVCKCSDTNVL